MKRRALALLPRPPFPLVDGGGIRSYNALKVLTKEYDTEVISFLPNKHDPSYRAGLEALTPKLSFTHLPHSMPNRMLNALRGALIGVPFTFMRYQSAEMAGLIRESIARHGEPDVVYFNNMHMTSYHGLFSKALRVVDTQNNDTTIMRRWAERQGNPLLRAFGNWQARLVESCLRRRLGEVDIASMVSQLEATELAAMNPKPRYVVAPNGVDCSFHELRDRAPGGTTLLFTGNMGWLPNEDAFLHFEQDILPLLRTPAIPNLRIVFAGAKPSGALQAMAKPPVELTGLVPDIRPYFREATVFIVPLRIGGGTRLKILEAMANGIPVVSTSVGCEGLGVTDGQELLIRDDPKGFAQAVRELLTDSARRELLVGAARKFVYPAFDWPQALRPMFDAIREELDRRG